MRRSKSEPVASLTGHRVLYILVCLTILYVAVVSLLDFSFASQRASSPHAAAKASRRLHLDSEKDVSQQSSPSRPIELPYKLPKSSALVPSAPPDRRGGLRPAILSGLVFSDPSVTTHGWFSEFHKVAREAWEIGRRLLEEMDSGARPAPPSDENVTAEVEKCPQSVVMSGAEVRERGKMMVLPCGLTLGSHVTIVGRPRKAHLEIDPKIAIFREGDGAEMMSQFVLELQGLKAVDGEEPPRILHFNPRLKGDWSGKPVIEQNTCYRMQWGTAQRCDGWKSLSHEETVDGLVKCEKWVDDEDDWSSESKRAWWLNRLIGQKKNISMDWPFPFAEDKLFVLTLRAGLEGYHIAVDGRHVTSFPYRTGFVLEDATGLALNGDLDIQSIFAASLPTSHTSFVPQRHLDMSSQWQARPLPKRPIELFIGILSSGSHFTERMAVRKSWMSLIRHSKNVVARFFVALHGRMEVNMELKKEAEFFGDIVIVPFLDSYDLVVLKTVAICEHGVRAVSAKHIMKCDDDTFVRVDSVLREVRKIPSNRSLYVGNMNYYHKPLRDGKWAVTYSEWPEEDYPPYADGPGYVVSSDIAGFIVSEFMKHTLRLFKMEDVSMGMWVEQFNSSRPVEYLHNVKFCQFGCIEGYYTAHYQSPRQMMCLWEKLWMGKPQCCNTR